MPQSDCPHHRQRLDDPRVDLLADFRCAKSAMMMTTTTMNSRRAPCCGCADFCCCYSALDFFDSPLPFAILAIFSVFLRLRTPSLGIAVVTAPASRRWSFVFPPSTASASASGPSSRRRRWFYCRCRSRLCRWLHCRRRRGSRRIERSPRGAGRGSLVGRSVVRSIVRDASIIWA